MIKFGGFLWILAKPRGENGVVELEDKLYPDRDTALIGSTRGRPASDTSSTFRDQGYIPMKVSLTQEDE